MALSVEWCWKSCSNDESSEEPPKVKFSEKTKQRSKDQKQWNDDKVSELINLLEERNCLWDIYYKKIIRK